MNLLRVREKRKESKLNQDEIGKRLGISAISYGKKENGQREFLVSELEKIAEVTKTPISYFFGK